VLEERSGRRPGKSSTRTSGPYKQYCHITNTVLKYEGAHLVGLPPRAWRNSQSRAEGVTIIVREVINMSRASCLF